MIQDKEKIQIGEALISCKYADAINEKRPMTVRVMIPIGEGYPLQQPIDPFAETHEARQQLDALEEHYSLQTERLADWNWMATCWRKKKIYAQALGMTARESRIACIIRILEK